MNILFLECAGVLVHSNYRNNETENIDIKKIRLLKKICDKGNAKVIISSSWRGQGECMSKSYFTLIDILTKNKIEVIGNTPYIKIEFENNISNYKKIKYGTGKAAEIQKWISEHNVNNFVILDDEDFDWIDYGYDKYWIQTSWFDGGLQQKHVDKAIKILNGVNYEI